VPITLSFVLKFLRDSSSISSKDGSKFVSPDFTSLIVSSTSFIILAGVEAPAVTPIDSATETLFKSSSAAVSMRTVFSHCLLHISKSFPVLELCLSPITTIKSDSAAI